MCVTESCGVNALEKMCVTIHTSFTLHYISLYGGGDCDFVHMLKCLVKYVGQAFHLNWTKIHSGIEFITVIK